MSLKENARKISKSSHLCRYLITYFRMKNRSMGWSGFGLAWECSRGFEYQMEGMGLGFWVYVGLDRGISFWVWV